MTKQTPDHDALLELLRLLDPLIGTWRGTGSGNYPTIDPFEYTETLQVVLDDRYPMLAYEQKTTLRDTGDASHWEYGFIRPVADSRLELSNVQDSGRVEVLLATRTDVDRTADQLAVTFQHIHLGHDPRLHATTRQIQVHGAELIYETRMATHTTTTPQLQTHLRATLQRA